MISSAFKNLVANFTDGRVTKVVLNNGAYEITDFELKQVSGSIMSLNYFVPYGSVASVTKIELKNNAGDVVSENVVNVPIASDTLLIQTIEVKEV